MPNSQADYPDPSAILRASLRKTSFLTLPDGEIVYPAELQIIDAVDDTPLPHGKEGEIIARGPGLFFGYVHPSDNHGNFIGDGYFRMGDLGCIVHDDYIVITGRKKDIIIRSIGNQPKYNQARTRGRSAGSG